VDGRFWESQDHDSLGEPRKRHLHEVLAEALFPRLSVHGQRWNLARQVSADFFLIIFGFAAVGHLVVLLEFAIDHDPAGLLRPETFPTAGPGLLTNAALFVLPSDLEGLSLALLDAMGAAVCVLTSNIPENREVIAGTGFTFQPGDATDLALMLQMLLSDPESRAVAGRNAQARVRELYLWPQIAAEIGHSYVELTDRATALEACPAVEAPATATSEQVG
jgi:glycosyltransferase involved in cell wall biosynthesis